MCVCVCVYVVCMCALLLTEVLHSTDSIVAQIKIIQVLQVLQVLNFTNQIVMKKTAICNHHDYTLHTIKCLYYIIIIIQMFVFNVL